MSVLQAHLQLCQRGHLMALASRAYFLFVNGSPNGGHYHQSVTPTNQGLIFFCFYFSKIQSTQNIESKLTNCTRVSSYQSK